VTITRVPEIPDLLIIEPKVFRDPRGFFLETFNEKQLQEAGLSVHFVQDNHSLSAKGILRGLHLQLKRPQGKLVRVTQGEVYDVAVDLRKGSPTFGKWFGMVLSADNFKQMYVPPGFAHGFCVTSETAEFLYKVTDYYDPTSEATLRWNDPTLNIPWPIQNPTLSNKDQAGLSLQDIAKKLV